MATKLENTAKALVASRVKVKQATAALDSASAALAASRSAYMIAERALAKAQEEAEAAGVAVEKDAAGVA